MNICCDHITVQEKLDYTFKYARKTFNVEITPDGIFAPEIGDYDGHVTRIEHKEKHMCGLMGYNPLLGDSCPACDEGNTKHTIMRALKKQLRLEGILEEYKV